MFLQQIQCIGTADSLNNSQQRSRLDMLESEKMIAQIDQIVDHIEELYKKAKEEEDTNTVRSSKICTALAVHGATKKLKNLNSRQKLVEAFNKFTTSDNLKNIIHKHSTAVQTASIPFWSAMTKTGKKTSELDTQTLTDLLVLRKILLVHQVNRRLFSTIYRTLIAATEILENLKKLSEISTTEPNEQQKTHEVDTEPYKLYAKLEQLYSAVKHAKCEYDRQLAEIAKENKISTESAEQQPTQSDELQQKFDQAFIQLHQAHLNLDLEIWKYYDQQIPRKYRAYSGENYELLRNWCAKQSQHSELAKELHSKISYFEKCYADDHEAAYSRAPRPRNYRIIPQIMTNPVPCLLVPCLLDPAIEDKIAQFLKYVIDPTLYSRYHPQEREIDTSTQSDDDNSRLLTIGGIAILGVVTIGAGWYLFSNDDSNTIDNRKIRSNDDNNTASNRKMQLSRKTTTSMQLAKPADVSATQTTDVPGQPNALEPNALAQTRQEQTSANNKH
jgi:hypothetical protein